MIFITVQNLVGIDAAVGRFSISRVWLENAYSRPKIEVFGVFDPLNGEQCEKFRKKAHPCASPRRLSHHA